MFPTIGNLSSLLLLVPVNFTKKQERKVCFLLFSPTCWLFKLAKVNFIILPILPVTYMRKGISFLLSSSNTSFINFSLIGPHIIWLFHQQAICLFINININIIIIIIILLHVTSNTRGRRVCFFFTKRPHIFNYTYK